MPTLKVYVISPSGGWYSYMQKQNEDFRLKCKKAIETSGLTVVEEIKNADIAIAFVDRGKDDTVRRGQANAQRLGKPAYKTTIDELKETIRHAKRDQRKRLDTEG